jgi:hypothetical protein
MRLEGKSDLVEVPMELVVILTGTFTDWNRSRNLASSRIGETDENHDKTQLGNQ